MKKVEKNIKFQITDKIISSITDFIKKSDEKSLENLFSDFHHADIAEILDELNIILKKYFQNILKINAKINIKNIDRYGINLRILNQNSYSNDKILFTKEISTPEELYIELIKILSK